MSAAAAIAAALVLLAGCRGETGSRYRCSCSFLTDFDDASRLDIEACASSPEEATSVGRGCAQSAAPAPVQQCACERVAGAKGCRVGECSAPLPTE